MMRWTLGLAVTLFAVNYRNTETYFGAIEGNWDDALDTGEKIAWAIESGFEGRPKRRTNAEAIGIASISSGPPARPLTPRRACPSPGSGSP
jgi:hypothetical protein